MINRQFLKTQIRSSLWISIGILIVLAFLAVGTMSLSPYFWDKTIEEPGVTQSFAGAISLLGEVNYFGLVGEFLAVAFAVTLAIKLISVEISKGYMSSWLTLPITRTSYFLTKIIAIFIAILMVIVPNYLIQLIVGGIREKDFGGLEVWVLTKLNLGLFLAFFFVTSMTVFFATFFNRTSYAVTLGIIVPAIFIILFFLSSNIAEIFNLNFLSFLKYLTFFSLFDFKQLIDANNFQFIWKFIIFFILSFGIYIGTTYLFKRKNLFF